MTKEENGKIIGYCKCGFKRMSGIEVVSKEENISDKLKSRGDGVSVMDDKEGFLLKCVKCGCSFSDVILLGESSTNESNVYLYKCKKCGNVVRETDGLS
jgi:hypothetical protein